MIRVLIVEDSAVEQELLAHILSADPQITVAGVAADGEMALAAVERLKPDVITMDIHMPRLNGFDTTRRIMESTPLPIIIVTSDYNTDDSGKSFDAMEAGALAIVRKPAGLGHPDSVADAACLVRIVKMMSEIKVVKRWPRPGKVVKVPSASTAPIGAVPQKINVVAVGASTGGPAVLQKIFTILPKDFSVPVLVVQHMANGFMAGFVRWLSATTGFPAHIAIHGEHIAPGHAYFAPDGYHMLVGKDQRIFLSGEEPENSLRPAVSRLFRSVAETFGSHAVGVLLTGMGRDGAADLKLLRNKGAVTVVQDRETSIVFGMPGEAVKIDAADHILAPVDIARLLTVLVTAKSGK
ncbi:MAG: chemotaxis-specific protein-glutamate methyltransferase CheB [Desulfuromonadaceae bacterium]